MDEKRQSLILDIIHDLTQPPSAGESRPGPIKRAQYRSAFTAGELAVLVELYEKGDTNIEDLPSAVAARILMRMNLAKATRRMAHTPVSGTFMTKRIELTNDGLAVAEFLYPPSTH